MEKFGEGVREGHTVEATSVKLLGAGSYKYMTRTKSVGILSFKAVQFLWPGFRELLGNGMFETLRCLRCYTVPQTGMEFVL